MDFHIGRLFKGDKTVWIIFFFLCVTSIMEVFSATSTLTYKSGYMMPILKHSGLWLLGILAMIGVLNVPCRYFRTLTKLLLVGSLLTLTLVLFVGESINGANRVLSIGGFTFQPSELAKLTQMLIIAEFLADRQTPECANREAAKYIVGFLMLFVAFIAPENLSTALIMVVVTYLMMFIGRVRWRQMAWFTAVGGGLAGLALAVILAAPLNRETDGEAPQEATEQAAAKDKAAAGKEKKPDGMFATLLHRASTWHGRIYDFVHDTRPADPKDYEITDANRQKTHAKIAIAKSNICGVGIGRSEERDFLSQAYSDFIYAIIIEETGIEGAFFVLCLYIGLFWRSWYIAARCERAFSAYLAIGLALLLLVQALFNMIVASGTGPVTGQPLPLISRGGTAIIFNCVAIGAILSISRTAKRSGSAQTATAAPARRQ